MECALIHPGHPWLSDRNFRLAKINVEDSPHCKA